MEKTKEEIVELNKKEKVKNQCHFNFKKADFIAKFISMNITEFKCLKLINVKFKEGIHDLSEYLSSKADELLIQELVLIDCFFEATDISSMIKDCGKMLSLKKLVLNNIY